MINPLEFLKEHSEHHFPKMYGPWIGMESFDPPWTKKELRALQQAGFLQFDDTNNRYRLTGGASGMAELLGLIPTDRHRNLEAIITEKNPGLNEP